MRVAHYFEEDLFGGGRRIYCHVGERVGFTEQPRIEVQLFAARDGMGKCITEAESVVRIDKICEIPVYQLLILPAQYLAYSRVAEKDFTSGRKDKDDCLAQLSHQEICPTLASCKLPWRNGRLICL